MENENENWQLVNGTADMEIEDIVRFDHDNKTYCVYKLEDGFFATDGLALEDSIGKFGGDGKGLLSRSFLSFMA